jgi:hypothetical protein
MTSDAWSQLNPQDSGETIGINYPHPKYPSARFDRMLYRSPTIVANSISLIGKKELKMGYETPKPVRAC